MFFNFIKHNLITIFCISLLINGCNNENSKLIIENNNTVEKIKKTTQPSVNKKYLKKRVLSNTIVENKKKLSELQLTSHYDSVKNLFLIFKDFIENGGSHNIYIPFPEINKRFVGIITDNKKHENMVKLESLK